MLEDTSEPVTLPYVVGSKRINGVIMEKTSLDRGVGALHALFLIPGQLLLICALLVPPSVIPRKHLYTIILPLIWGFDLYYYFSVGGSIDVKATMNGVAASMNAFQALSLLFFRNPRETFVRVGSSNAFLDCSKDSRTLGNPNNHKHPQNLITRIRWVLNLIYLHSNDSYDRSPSQIQIRGRRNDPYWRRKYITQNVFELMFCLLAIHNMFTIPSTDVFFVDTSLSIDSPLPKEFSSWTRDAVAPRSFRVLLVGLNCYAALNIGRVVYGLGTALLGGLGLVSEAWGGQENVPVCFGPPSIIASDGLSGFWGKFWHQEIRNMISDPGKFLARYLGLPRSSTLARIIEVGGAFFISGLMHATMAPFNPPYSRHLHLAMFFSIQYLGVALEGIVSNVFNKWSPLRDRGSVTKALLMCVRLIWVWNWFYLTAPPFVEELRNLGFWDFSIYH